MKEFKCSYKEENGKTIRWSGSYEIMATEPNAHELLINGRGSEFQAVLGYCTYGNYVCIPLLDIGCSLAYWSDIFWNTEKLSQVMNKVDAVTLASALNAYGKS